MNFDKFNAPVIRYVSYNPEPVDDEAYRRQIFTTDENGKEKFHYDEGKIAEWYARRENLRFHKGLFYALRGVKDIDLVTRTFTTPSSRTSKRILLPKRPPSSSAFRRNPTKAGCPSTSG